VPTPAPATGLIGDSGGQLNANGGPQNFAPQAAASLTGVVRVPLELIANNGGGLIANNGGGYRLMAAGATAPAPAVEVGLVDAGGKPLAGTTPVTTDAQGRYSFASVPAGGAVFVQARLNAGGRTYLLGALAPLAAPTGNVADISPASSLVADKAGAVLAEQDGKAEAFDATRLGQLVAAAQGALASTAAPDFSQPATAIASSFDRLLQADATLATAAWALDRNVGTPMVRTKQAFAGGIFSPEHVAAASNGDLYIAGLNDDTVWKLPAGATTPIAWAQDPALKWPHGIALDAAGNVYVGRRIDLYHDDPNNPTHNDTPGKQVFKIDPTGKRVTPLPYEFASPTGLCMDHDGHTLYVANAAKNEVLAFDTGTSQVRTLARDIAYANGVAQDGTGALYVAHLRYVGDAPDPKQNGWRGCLSKVAADGQVSLFYPGYLDVTGSDMLEGIAIDKADNLYVSNNWGNTIFKFTPKQKKIETFLKFENPTGLAFDKAGNLVVANYDSGALSLVTP
jgi:hypothetical protein